MAVAAIFAAAGDGWAQAGKTRLPSTVEPGRREVPAPAAPVAPLTLRWTIDLPPGPSVPRRMAGQPLDLKSLSIKGVTVYRREQLLRLYRPYLGKTITFAEFYGIAQKIQALYHRDGYVLSFAYVPPQRVRDGKFTIMVVEGYIRQVRIAGAGGAFKRRLERIFAPIVKSRPLNTRAMERYLLIVNDIAGVRATGILQRAPKGRGASDLTVKITHNHLNSLAELDNRGSAFVGPWRAGFTTNATSLWHRGGRISARARVAAPTDELTSFSVDASAPISLEGLTVGGGFGYITSTPGSALAISEIQTRSYTGDLTATYPLIRSRDLTVRARGALSFLNASVDSFGALLSSDRIRTFSAGLSYTQSGFLRGGTGIRADIVQAIPWLDASDPLIDDMSRADADTAFTKVTFDLARTQLLWGRFQLGLGLAGQYSRTPLPASAEFAVGGSRFGRAYDAGEVTGEGGFSASAEFRYAWRRPSGILNRLTPYAFYDYGKVWDTASASSAGLSESLSSAGAGIRLRLLKGIAFDLQYAHPLDRQPTPAVAEKGRISVLLSARY